MLPSNAGKHIPTVTDVYTDIHGFRQLRAEENKDEAIKKVAQQFESMFINIMLKDMRSANKVFGKDNLFESSETDFYRDLHDHQLALTISSGKGIGIADALYRQMTHSYLNKGQGKVDGVSEDTIQEFRRSLSRDMGLYKNGYPQYLPHQYSAIEKNRNQQAENAKNIQGDKVAIAASPDDFIRKILPHAKNAAKQLGIPSELLVAQAALETGWGQKVIAAHGRSSNNVFNIKSGGIWQGDSVNVKTLEYVDGVVSPENADFRSYSSLEQAFSDYVHFVKSQARYQNALDTSGTQTESDGEHYIRMLHEGGYATDPKYADKVLAVFKRINDSLSQQAAVGVQAVSQSHNGI